MRNTLLFFGIVFFKQLTAQTNTFLSSGDVGIGTTSPAATLPVYRSVTGDNMISTEVVSTNNWTGLNMKYSGKRVFLC